MWRTFEAPLWVKPQHLDTARDLDIRTVMRFSPDILSSLVDKAEGYRIIGKADLATGLLEQLSAVTPESGWLLCALGRAHSENGDLRQAIHGYERARAIGDASEDRELIAAASLGLSRAYASLGKPLSAQFELLRAQSATARERLRDERSTQ